MSGKTIDQWIPREVISAYRLDHAMCTPVNTGWINRTFAVTREHDEFILQQLNPIFHEHVHLDMAAVTDELLWNGLPSPRLIPTVDATLWCKTGTNVWRMMTRLPGISLTEFANDTQVRSAAKLVARFHRATARLSHRFHFTRPDAHNTELHFSRLQKALADKLERADMVAPLADAIFEAARVLDLHPQLPRRLIHGDLKASNILMLNEEAHAIIDLDTLAYGDMAVELGDALRSWCNRTSESDPNATFDLSFFKAAMNGYAEGSKGLLESSEIEAIVPGAERIALELASRFALDVMQDRYFGWDETRFSSRIEHNLNRVKAQTGLARSIRTQKPELHAIVKAAFKDQAA